MEVLVGEVDLEMDGFEWGFRARVHFGARKGKGLGGSRGAERADRFKQLFSSDTDA